MHVSDGVTRIAVTAGPQHTLREAARRMTARNVGAAVAIDPAQPGPRSVTERDLLRSNGAGQDIDVELVSDHLSAQLTYAAADWSLERAAEEMVRGGLRHVVVLNRSEAVGIFRCVTSCAAGRPGATCEVGEA